MKNVFVMIPLVVISAATLVALISYLVSLCKYFYISPFVVAWSMATKRTDKIIDFLITGLSIFFRPVLIVLFVYLSLFLHILVKDFFIFASTNQFLGLTIDPFDLQTSFYLGAIVGLLEMFGTLAASYVIWKLIVGGPGWALSLIGVDGKHYDMISGALESNLAKRSFVA